MSAIIKKLDILYNNENSRNSFKNYSLKNIKHLLKFYSDPHKKIKTIHIAGTNGKGSVACMLNSILIAAGERTGLYTSPHLIRINERIKINNKEIPRHRLIKYTEELFNILDNENKLHPTYFDALTLFAFRYFYEEKVDIAIIEAGLGGRLDSTNVISPAISVITDISFDHMHILGNTVQEIAHEKAGIIKKGSIVATTNRNKEVLDIISNKSKKQSSELYVLNKDFFVENIKLLRDKKITNYDFSLKSKQYKYIIKNIELRIAGGFQIINSSLAILSSILLKKSGIIVSEDNIQKGLRNVTIPGRLQILSKDPLIIFDPAHNPAALNATLSAVKEEYPNKKYNAIVSFMIDKDYSSMFKILQKQLNGNIFYYELDDKRCLKIPKEKYNKNKQIYDNIISVNNVTDLSKIVFKSLKSNSVLLITGTFRIYNIAKQLKKTIKKK